MTGLLKLGSNFCAEFNLKISKLSLDFIDWYGLEWVFPPYVYVAKKGLNTQHLNDSEGKTFAGGVTGVVKF